MLSCLHAHGSGHRHSAVFVRNARNPLLKDPTRTTLLRARFQAAMRARFARLKKAVVEWIDTKDALGLKDRKSFITVNVQEREYQFHTDSQKLTEFSEWFKQSMDANILSVAPGSADPQKPWTAEYVESAYKRGQLNAYLSSKEAQLMQAQGIGEQTQEQFLRSAFLAPEAVSKVQLLATRAFEELKGVTSSMSSQMNRILAQGMTDGSGARDIAREMAGAVDSMTSKRALVIARTELINAHAEGQLDAFTRLGVDELGVKAEWSTAGDDRVCEQCASNEGALFTVEEARGLIPLHPNCRCAWIPAPQKTIAEAVKGTVKSSGSNVIPLPRPEPAPVPVITPQKVVDDLAAKEAARKLAEAEAARKLLEAEALAKKLAAEKAAAEFQAKLTAATNQPPLKSVIATALVSDPRVVVALEGLQTAQAGEEVYRAVQKLKEVQATVIHETLKARRIGPRYEKPLFPVIPATLKTPVEQAESFLKDIIPADRLSANAVFIHEEKRKFRAFYQPVDRTIHLHLGVDADTVAHEFGHHLQQDPQVWKNEVDYLKKRAGITPSTKLMRLFPRKKEFAFASDFAAKGGSSYSAKVYGSWKDRVTGEWSWTHGEVLSTGLQRLQLYPLQFWNTDREFFLWTVEQIQKPLDVAKLLGGGPAVTTLSQLERRTVERAAQRVVDYFKEEIID